MPSCYSCKKSIIFKLGPDKKLLACDSQVIYIKPNKNSSEHFLNNSGKFIKGDPAFDGIPVHRVHKCKK
jgi:hypothetical protein